MKKIFLLLSVIGVFSFSSCSDDDTIVNNYFEAEVFEINNVNFGIEPNGLYTSTYILNPPIFPADMLLVYRLAGVDAGRDVWELIPRTLYYDGGRFVDVDYNFTTSDILFSMASNYSLTETPELLINEVYRVVIIPGFDNSAVEMRSAPAVDFKDYNAVVKHYNINESNIKQLTKK